MQKAEGEVKKHEEDLGVSVQGVSEPWKMIKKKVPKGSPFYPPDKLKNWEEMSKIAQNAKRKVGRIEGK